MDVMESGDKIIKKGRRKLFNPPMLTSSNGSLFPSLSSASKLPFSQNLPRPMSSSATPAMADEVVSHPWSRFSSDIPAAPSLGEDLFLTQMFQNRKFTNSNDEQQTILILDDTEKPEDLFPSDTTSLLLSQNQNFLSPCTSSRARAIGGISSDIDVTIDRLKVHSSNFSNYDSQEMYSSELNDQLYLYHSLSEAISNDKFIQPERQSDLFKSANKNLKTDAIGQNRAKSSCPTFRTPYARQLANENSFSERFEPKNLQQLDTVYSQNFNSLFDFSHIPDSDGDQLIDAYHREEESSDLHHISEIPESYRSVFNFENFNAIQSQVFDDVFYTDKPLVVSAPTGSGKTVVFEMAIVRLLVLQQSIQQNDSCTFKVVYMAPIKALCSERFEDWNRKFSPHGLKCLELTGDSEIEDYFELQGVNIIFTTPEKWDHMTRRWRDNRLLLLCTCLFLIDEVHTLNHDSRGATLEAVVSRMKTVRSAIARSDPVSSSPSGPCDAGIRFIAVSATIPNIEDIAEWLGAKDEKAIYHKLDDSHRPVKLRKVVLGYPCSDKISEFRFDLTLNYKLAGIIQMYSELKPTLVFCATRKGAVQAASTLVKDAKFIFNVRQKQKLQQFASSFRDTKLAELIASGVGYHHAGMEANDRRLVENIFAKGELAVLVSTSTLAMGVNLPAHLVIVKSTQHYVNGVYQEYSETQVLQMIGRAGRPQFDTSATAVIITRSSTKSKYESLLNGTQVIESSLHQHLVEHLNAEIVLETINDVSVAIEWIRSTYLYVRVNKNPTYYGIPEGLTEDKVEYKLQELCLKNLNSLAAIQLVEMDDDCFVMKSTNTGRLMARYCVAFETMKNFHNISGNETLEDILEVLCQSHELSDIQLRVNEKRTLNSLNKSKDSATISLIQAHLGSLPLQDFALQQDMTKIIRICQRISRCLVEMLWNQQNFAALRSAVTICKCFAAKLWENSKFVVRQLSGIGVALATALVNAGITSFEEIRKTNPRDLELIVNRQPPFGNHILEAVGCLPKYDLTVKQTVHLMANCAEIIVNVLVTNVENPIEKSKNHTTVLLVGDCDCKTVYRCKISDAQLDVNKPWTRKIDVKRAGSGDELSLFLISQQWVGLDCQVTFVPKYTTPVKIQVNTNQESVVASSKQKCKKTETASKITAAVSQPQKQSANNKRYQKNPATNTRDIAECLERHKNPVVKVDKDKPNSSKSNDAMDNYCKEIKRRLEDYENTPSIKRLKMSVTATPTLKEFEFQPSRPKLQRKLLNTGSEMPVEPTGWEALDLFQKRSEATLEWGVEAALTPSNRQSEDASSYLLDAVDCYVSEDFQTTRSDLLNSSCVHTFPTNSSFDELPDLDEGEAGVHWGCIRGNRWHGSNRINIATTKHYVPMSRIVEKYNSDELSDSDPEIEEDNEFLLERNHFEFQSGENNLAFNMNLQATVSNESLNAGVSKSVNQEDLVEAKTASHAAGRPLDYDIGENCSEAWERANFDLLSSFFLNEDDDSLSKCDSVNREKLRSAVTSSFFTSECKEVTDEDLINCDIFSGIF